MRTLVAAAEPPERPLATGGILAGEAFYVGGTGGCTAPWLYWPPPQTFPTITTTVVRLHWQSTN